MNAEKEELILIPLEPVYGHCRQCYKLLQRLAVKLFSPGNCMNFNRKIRVTFIGVSKKKWRLKNLVLCDLCIMRFKQKHKLDNF